MGSIFTLTPSRNQSTVMVTGSSGQLGSNLVDKLLLSGSTVIGLDRRPGNQSHLSSKRESSNYKEIVADINSPDIFKDLQTREIRLDGLACLAGVGVYTPFEERTQTEIHQVLEQNVTSLISFIQNIVPLLRSPGSVVFVASVYGLVGPDKRIYGTSGRLSSEVYGAAKAALIHLARYFAVYFGDKDIRFNSISPGGVFNHQSPDFVTNYSNRVPLGRMAREDEICDAILFLLSSSSSYVTGHNLIVDGGLSAW